jgi:hypothetical protein
MRKQQPQLHLQTHKNNRGPRLGLRRRRSTVAEARRSATGGSRSPQRLTLAPAT